jgi:uncharacterized protein with HEPN domain
LAISFVSSERKSGRAATPGDALKAAVRVARQALALVASDSEASYLANEERQLAIERLLLRFGEALKAVPQDVLDAIDPAMDWSGPKRFRDLAAHWYTEGLDHRLIWRALQNELPKVADAIEAHLNSGGGEQSD